jgi:hypothetical protein
VALLLYVLLSATGVLNTAEVHGYATTAKTRNASELRDWTDASGRRHARAVLLNIKGSKLSLQRADGKLVSTTLVQLSETDRQYVATHQDSFDSDINEPKHPFLEQTIVKEALRRLPSLDQLPAALRPAGVPNEQSVVPATLVYARVSRDFLEDYVDRTVRQHAPVHDNILGARIQGESDTQGKTHIVLKPNDSQVLADIEFVGTVHSRTRGYKGPAVMHYVSDETFVARKPISMGDSGLGVAPATASVKTRLQTTSIELSLPRLIGRIAQRIAWRQDARARGQAQSITSQHSAATISAGLDQRIDRSVAKVQDTLRSQIAALEFNRGSVPRVVHFRSTADYVEVAMIRDGATSEELSLEPPAVEGNPDIAVRVHRTVIGSALADPQISQKLAPMLVKLLQVRIAQKALAIVGVDADSPAISAKWKVDLNWLAVDFTDVKREAIAPLVAAINN